MANTTLEDPPSRSSSGSSSLSREKKEHPVSKATTNVSEHTAADTFSYVPAPPPLNYTVRTRRRERYIIIFFALLFVESGILPLILFYSLRWGAHLSVTKNLAIITSLIGTVSGMKIAQRTYQLWFRDGHISRRPIGSGRWGVDCFHVLISIALWAFFVPLIIGSSLTPANVPTVTMALPCLMLTFCIPLLITGIFDRHIRLPFRVSSLPAGEVLPPLTYTIVEDIIAVDGGGGLEFRQAWRHRYEASRVMRHLLRVCSIAWGLSGFIIASVLIAAAWTAPTDTAYGLGYGIPWLWAMVSSAVTVAYTQKELRKEAREWDADHVHRSISLHVKEHEGDREADRRHLETTRTRTESRPGVPSVQPSGRETAEHPVHRQNSADARV
ncbi:hypothetical protein EW026_g8432 [Hermanssonia centrifuga]|uniref:Uncharacterized protein n=1 Tax=Hermanssonia centrifuga TaxID=98765 RepID=A0A4V3X924_9APHY|nr:hypothetical protein EW026_g8432 [Hermanssonia centrifuga]